MNYPVKPVSKGLLTFKTPKRFKAAALWKLSKPHHQGSHLVVPDHLIIYDHGAPPNRGSLQTTPFRIAGELKQILTPRPIEQLPELLEGFELCHEDGLEDDSALVKANVHLAHTMNVQEVGPFRRHLRHNADIIYVWT